MRNPYLKSTKCQAVLSGHRLEVYLFGKPVYYNFSAKHNDRALPDPKNHDENRKRSHQHAKRMVRRLVNANYQMWFDQFGKPCWAKFLTLTFAEHITDIDAAMEEFTYAMKRLNYRIYKNKKAVIKYLGVIEFQKNGRVHFHVIFFNLPYIDNIIDVFNEVWGKGHMKINAIDDVKDVGLYISKYMTKTDDKRLEGRKRYFTSRELFRPMQFRDEQAVIGLHRLLPHSAKEYDKTYETKHTGQTRYIIYDLKGHAEVRKAIIAKHKALMVHSKKQ